MLTSPTSDVAAPGVEVPPPFALEPPPFALVPPPFALSGASPFLHARHEEQRFLFLLESSEWLHRLHSHDEVRRVADHIVSFGILLRESSRARGRGQVAAGLHGNLEEKILLFLSVEFILIYIRHLQYRSEIPPSTSNGGKAKATPAVRSVM